MCEDPSFLLHGKIQQRACPGPQNSLYIDIQPRGLRGLKKNPKTSRLTMCLNRLTMCLGRQTMCLNRQTMCLSRQTMCLSKQTM